MTDFQHKLLLLKIFHKKLNSFLYNIDIESIDEDTIDDYDLEYLNKVYSLITTYNNIDSEHTCKSNKSINRLASMDFIEISDVNDDLINDNQNNDIYVKTDQNAKNFGDMCDSDEDIDTEKRSKLIKKNKYIDDAVISLDDDNDDDENILLIIESVMNNNTCDVYIPLRDNPCSKKCSFNEYELDVRNLISLDFDI
jgi:hypothetical protein